MVQFLWLGSKIREVRLDRPLPIATAPGGEISLASPGASGVERDQWEH